ncbi:PEP-CTERM sorting domain-containing protein [Bythopirellula goksoeyrii]|uniref:PEP-CTERM protein-sorting domain-containing protein n=1 Tax=Bythopirellula goksoeyrii TaxID=1400387 RepID=A0A5B9QQ95_9BACT|nr:PEP-CTERM sorting domain-containing protein [Bythopirellula goksoeyrii]QEG36301.1 hypothetical protein Pr1d_36130 [Bythopirellula goksoeyrii]
MMNVHLFICKRNQSKAKVFLVLSLLLISSVGVRLDSASAQVTMKFPATRDWTVYGDPGEQMYSTGDFGFLRGYKFGGENSAHFDFDTEAMGIFLQNNPGKATWTLNIFPATGNDPLDPNTASKNLPATVTFQTVESTNDWVEGDGQRTPNFGWTSGTAAVTYFYAQTVHNGGVLDAENSLIWNDPDSGPYTFSGTPPNNAAYGVPASVTNANPTPAFTNSKSFTNQDLQDAFLFGESAAVEVDPDIIDAMVNDEYNRGIRLGAAFFQDEFGVWQLDNSERSNWVVFGREEGESVTAFLEVTVEPLSADFDSDGDVDGADFLKWQRDGLSANDLVNWQAEYGASSLIANVASVPEPCSMFLLLSAGSLLLVARRKNRS